MIFLHDGLLRNLVFGDEHDVTYSTARAASVVASENRDTVRFSHPRREVVMLDGD